MKHSLKQLGEKVTALTKEVDMLRLKTPAVSALERTVGKLERQVKDEIAENEKKFEEINTKLDLVGDGESFTIGGGRKKSKRKSRRKSRRKSIRRKSKERRVSKRRRR